MFTKKSGGSKQSAKPTKKSGGLAKGTSTKNKPAVPGFIKKGKY